MAAMMLCMVMVAMLLMQVMGEGASSKRIDDSLREESCAICHEDFSVYERIDIGDVLPCHPNSFHRTCISTWLRKSSLCPICNRHIPAPARDHTEVCKMRLHTSIHYDVAIFVVLRAK